MGASLLIFKNKSDVQSSMTEDDIRQVCFFLRLLLTAHSALCARNATLPNHQHEQGLQLDNIRTHKWKIMTCSAMTGQNLQEGLQWVVQDAKDRLFLY